MANVRSNVDSFPGSSLVSSSLSIFRDYSGQLQTEITDPSRLYHHLSRVAPELLDEYGGHGDSYSVSSLQNPTILTHHLLNGVRMAISRDPTKLVVFLNALSELIDPRVDQRLNRIAHEMKEHEGMIVVSQLRDTCMIELVVIL
uniref:Uncharacterized protein n=1 Tax=Amphimedon queenslandica TaxID=400682 RepID=A0A1X7TC05_AMPQE